MAPQTLAIRLHPPAPYHTGAQAVQHALSHMDVAAQSPEPPPGKRWVLSLEPTRKPTCKPTTEQRNTSASGRDRAPAVSQAPLNEPVTSQPSSIPPRLKVPTSWPGKGVSSSTLTLWCTKQCTPIHRPQLRVRSNSIHPGQVLRLQPACLLRKRCVA